MCAHAQLCLTLGTSFLVPLNSLFVHLLYSPKSIFHSEVCVIIIMALQNIINSIFMRHLMLYTCSILFNISQTLNLFSCFHLPATCVFPSLFHFLGIKQNRLNPYCHKQVSIYQNFFQCSYWSSSYNWTKPSIVGEAEAGSQVNRKQANPKLPKFLFHLLMIWS